MADEEVQTNVVNEDLVEGAAISRTREGIEIVRAFYVSNVEGEPYQVVFNALTAEGIPRYGETHPSVQTIKVVDISGEGKDAKQVRLLVTYRPLKGDELVAGDEARIEVSTTLVEVDTNRDVNGDLITVEYEGEYRDSSGAIQFAELPEQTGTVRVQVPVMTVRFTRKEKGIDEFDFKNKVGTTNSDEFLGESERKWLLTGLGAVTEDGGDTYVVTYEFMLAPGDFLNRTWDVDVAYVIPETGEIPPGIDADNGTTRVVVYEAVDFNAFKLPSSLQGG